MAEILLDGQRARPIKALEGGYKFRFTDVQAALDDLLR
jgi:NAD dependent epimerase/dehydratase family enzyme